MNNEIKEILDRLKGLDNDYHYCLKKDISFNDNMYCSHILLDYITNLQQENELLKEENKHIFANVNDEELLRSNAMNWAEAQDYKLRIEKAIDYLQYATPLRYQDLLNILQNGSDENE